ncbi:hypothetical protein MTR_6g088415 [Medicago truncatula]|uniref:Uncharacterized protein n=1 Tax=Medicago truncatula TaxID=3880 RepID=A0A072UBI2_MEDTR|nr:hypothetical protein MTR_6g088415 [Medicago truncatula]
MSAPPARGSSYMCPLTAPNHTPHNPVTIMLKARLYKSELASSSRRFVISFTLTFPQNPQISISLSNIKNFTPVPRSPTPTSSSFTFPSRSPTHSSSSFTGSNVEIVPKSQRFVSVMLPLNHYAFSHSDIRNLAHILALDSDPKPNLALNRSNRNSTHSISESSHSLTQSELERCSKVLAVDGTMLFVGSYFLVVFNHDPTWIKNSISHCLLRQLVRLFYEESQMTLASPTSATVGEQSQLYICDPSNSRNQPF